MSERTWSQTEYNYLFLVWRRTAHLTQSHTLASVNATCFTCERLLELWSDAKKEAPLMCISWMDVWMDVAYTFQLS